MEAVRRELREKRKGVDGGDIIEGAVEEEIDPQQAIRDEIDREFAKALASGKKKRKRLNEDDLERSMDEELSSLRERMKNAAEVDAIANSNKKPAIAKLKMLNEVTNMLNNKVLQDSILDNQLLDTIRLWLEPLPDRSLPGLDIQTEMLDVMDNLPIASDHLRESGVGKIVYFYTKSPRVETRVRRKAEQLVARWSRLVIKRSENYRERRHEQREYRQEDMARQPKKFRPEPAEEEADPRRMHVRIPQAVSADYDIVPQSVVRIDKTKAKPDTSFKRLKDKMRSIKTGQKRSTPKVSIQGKDLGV
ncbi:Transcription factor iws1 [Apophysomyces sp. BC1034]|nr:Transcription factor iws1 [Apophysomyces sp. BC1021]KAG0192648.1 Transcription factor iws1 [Apophysomyces sp. BC1034]